MRSILLTSAALLLALGGAVTASADELDMQQTGPAAPAPVDMDVPARGLTMEQVENRYGKPESIDPAVGEPPITRWDYPDYAVYFEHNFVIQSVAK